MEDTLRIALDLETVTDTEDPDFEDPSDWTVFAAALGVSGDIGTETTVLLRDGKSLTHEYHLWDRMLSWIKIRMVQAENVQIITYNGERYDLPIVRYRMEELDRQLGTRLVERWGRVERETTHIDLLQAMREMRGHLVSLDDALATFNIDYDTPKFHGEAVSGENMLDFGAAIMANAAPPEMIDATRRYARSDVKPLFELHRKMEYRDVLTVE